MTITNTLNTMFSSVRQHKGMFNLEDLLMLDGIDLEIMEDDFFDLESTAALLKVIHEDLPDVITTMNLKGHHAGFWICKELACAWLMWAMPGFHLDVIQEFILRNESVPDVHQYDGLYLLDGIHDALCGNATDKDPATFLRLESTRALMDVMTITLPEVTLAMQLTGQLNGVWACHEMGCAYEMWLFPDQRLTVILDVLSED